MKQSNLHLVAFNVPFPANYGGVIDVFYKMKALKELGVNVHLHCFQYGREEADELLAVCEMVYYYERNTSVFQHFSGLPYIVKSRINNALLDNLLKNDFPIIFEGLHCCGILNHPKLMKRVRMARMHNVEWQYYEHLAKQEKHLLKRLFFKIESIKLKRFEKIIHSADVLLPISPNDTFYYETHFPNTERIYVPAFHPNEVITSKIGKGDYALFHGDLSVKDNEDAAIYLINSVFNDLDIPLVIAGLNPSERLLAKASEKVKIRANLTHKAMNELIQNAHVNVLVSFHSAGMKLKLLNALFKGRFCVVNEYLVDGTGMDEYCFVGKDAKILKRLLTKAFTDTFTAKDIAERQKLINGDLSNEKSARLIMNYKP
jgi:hypothetical protein